MMLKVASLQLNGAEAAMRTARLAAGLMVWVALGGLVRARAQEQPPASSPAPASVPAPTSGEGPAVQNAAPQTLPAVATPARPAGAKKGKKVPYFGPADVIVLEPTPMLDEEGRQRLDPDGKPMFNPPVMQQRDKFGHPVFDDKGKPVFQTAKDLGYDKDGKKIHAGKDKTPKTMSVAIVHGTLTVDGMTAKAQLNYDIKDLKYLYFYAPWVGMTVVSNEPFPGAIEQKDAFRQQTLTVAAGEHSFQLYSDKMLLGKRPEPAYVLVDRNFSMPVQFPVMGYGALRQAPYAFPGSKADVEKSLVAPPPLPDNMRPAQVLAPCPAGQMRAASAGPGQGTPPCVTIAAPAARPVAPISPPQ